jgi:hypothetical protein
MQKQAFLNLFLNYFPHLYLDADKIHFKFLSVRQVDLGGNASDLYSRCTLFKLQSRTAAILSFIIVLVEDIPL